MKDEISAAEWRAYNRGILQEYLIHTRLEPGERRELFRWVNSGHRVHGENPWGLYDSHTHHTLDFIPAYRLYMSEQEGNGAVP